ncbi:hypothetical protein BH11CYA1_BH11CYA1_35130 [soil metagenome]
MSLCPGIHSMESTDSHDAQVQVPNQSDSASVPTTEQSDGPSTQLDAARPGVFAPGVIVGGSYEVIELLGRGAMGMVYRVKHVTLPAEYALKILTDNKHDETSVIRFQNEAQAIAKLTHPNIVAIYNFGVHEGSMPFYVMDLLEGEDLQDKIVFSGPRSQTEALTLFIEACAGLSYAHRKGILHRDVKPANFLILDKPDAHGVRLKVVDFGIVKFAEEIKPDAQKLTAMGIVCGSPSYMSPEQATGQKVDPRSDVYSLGVSLFEALTGKIPFRGRSASETMMMHVSTPSPSLSSRLPEATFSEDIESVVAKMMAKEPMYRYQSMDAVAVDLRNVIEGKPLSGAFMAQSNFGAGTIEGSSSNMPASVGRGASFDRFTDQLSDRETFTNEQDVSGGYETSGDVESTGEFVVTGEYQDVDDDDDDNDGEPNDKSNIAKLVIISLFAVSTISALGFFAYGMLVPSKVDSGLQAASGSKAKVDLYLDGVLPLEGVTESGASTAAVKLTSSKYFSKFVTVDGKKLTQFDFPSKASDNPLAYIGTTLLDRVATFGVCRFPSDSPIYLVPTPDALSTPEFFNKFRAGDISGLVMHPHYASDDLLAAAAKIPGVRELRLMECQNFTPKIVPILNKFRSLKSLFTFNCSFDGSELAKADIWPNLEVLEISRCRQITPLLKKVCGSKNLTKLDISETGAVSEDYKYVSTLSNLKALILDKNKVSVEDLCHLSKLSNLVELSLVNIHIKESSMAKTIEKFPSLRFLVVDRGHFKKQDIIYLNEHKPSLNVRFFSPAKAQASPADLYFITPDRL